jgi:hypothetical protein
LASAGNALADVWRSVNRRLTAKTSFSLSMTLLAFSRRLFINVSYRARDMLRLVS